MKRGRINNLLDRFGHMPDARLRDGN